MLKKTGKEFFENKEIVHSFRGEELLNLPDTRRVCGIIQEIFVNNPSDMEIMEKWRTYFRRKGIPYIVTQGPNPNRRHGSHGANGDVQILYKQI